MQYISIWLATTDEEKTYLGEIIKRLADTYDAPTFDPHLTVYAYIDADKVDLVIQTVKEAIKDIKLFEVSVDRLNLTDNYFKTVFIDFKSNDFLTSINQKLERVLSPYSKKYTFKPHTSLIYKMLSIKDKEEIIKSLMIKKSFTIAEIAVITGDDAESAEGVASWKLLYSQKLQD